MVIKVGINGFGRIGRVIFRTCHQNPELEVAAINDPAIDIEYICYLIKFDSTHGKFKGSITHSENKIVVDETIVKIFHDKLPSNVPWQSAEVQYVVEASGIFTSFQKASGHLASEGVRRVIVTAPSVDVPMVILGVNHGDISIETRVISSASSTLYCLAPIVKILNDHYGVAEGFMTSIHAMTPSLKPLDGLCLRGKHWRDHRSIHQNIIPAATGACKALGKIIPEVKDKLLGLAFRVPIVNVSVLDLTMRLNKETSLEEITKTVNTFSKSTMRNIIKVSNEDAVSSDFAGDQHSCILDIDSSLQLKKNFFKLVCWYENEYSYACRVVDLIMYSEKQYSETVPRCKMIFVRSKNKKVAQNHYEQGDNELCKCRTDTAQVAQSKSKVRLRIRSPVRTIVPKNLPSSHSSAKVTKNSDIFRIWSDDIDKKIGVTSQDSSNYESCNDTTSQSQINNKAQQRLECVKQEFSKMVSITEALLKKCSNIRDINFDANVVENKTKAAKTSVSDITKSVEKNIKVVSPREEILKNCNPLLEVQQLISNSKNKNSLPEVKVTSKAKNNHILPGVEIMSNSINNNNFPEVKIKPRSKNNNYLPEVKFTSYSKNHNSSPDVNIASSSKNNNYMSEVKDMTDSKNTFSKVKIISNSKNNMPEVKTILSESKNNILLEEIISDIEDRSKHNLRRDNISICNDNVSEWTITSKTGSNENLNTLTDTISAQLSPYKRNDNHTHKVATKLYVDDMLKSQVVKTITNSINGLSHNIDLKEEKNKESVCKEKDPKISDHRIWFKDSTILENDDVDSGFVSPVKRRTGEEASSFYGDDISNFTISNVDVNDIKIKGKLGNSSNETELKDTSTTEEGQQENSLPMFKKKSKEHNAKTIDKPKRSIEIPPEILNNLNKLLIDPIIIVSDQSKCVSSTLAISREHDTKMDIYDKLDSVSASDSDNSFQIHERKSQVINISDLTNSIEDLVCLDKICRIIEISDELSDNLFSSLGDPHSDAIKKAKWSFRDLCKRIKLDEFCNKLFAIQNQQCH